MGRITTTALLSLSLSCGIPKAKWDAKVQEADDCQQKQAYEKDRAANLASRVKELETQAAELAQQSKAAEEKAAQLDAQSKEAEGKAATLAPQLQDTETQRQTLERRVTELEEGKKAVEEKVTTLETQLTNKEQEIGELVERARDLSALNEELSKSKEKLAEAKAQLEKRSSQYESLAKSLKTEIQSGKIELTELKGRMTVKMKDKILFASGSTEIGKEGKKALDKVADAFKDLKDKMVRVEGHTDDLPVDPKGPFPTNWELSLARSMAVVNHLQAKGVDPTLLSAAGYGQYHPIARNNSPENRSKNRRIEIVLVPKLEGHSGKGK